MIKRCYRYYGGLFRAQEKWLNRMAKKGFRLKRVGKFLYEFEACLPGQYEYRVEWIGQKTSSDASDYLVFLEDCGYTVFYKNLNLNYSIGKVKVRPWADKGARLSTNRTTFNRELLIVEKECDGKPFELHTSYEDQMVYYAALRKPWLFLFLLLFLIAVFSPSYLSVAFAILPLFPIAIYQVQIYRTKKKIILKEW